MTPIVAQPIPPPPPPPFQFRLRTLLLLFVVLGSSLAVFGAWGIVVFGLVVGLAIYIYKARTLFPRTRLILLMLSLLCLAGWLFWPFVIFRCSLGPRVHCYNRLQSLWFALMAYREKHGSLPPAYVTDASGKPTHSWRALILPELDDLHKGYDYTQPWDSPKNRPILAAARESFHCSGSDGVPPATVGDTSYVAVVGPKAAFAVGKPRKRGESDFPDKGSTTIMLVEVAHSGIPWTEPRDLDVSELHLTGANCPALARGVHENEGHVKEFFVAYRSYAGVHVLMADGSIGILKTAGLSDEELRKKLQIGGCKGTDVSDFAYFERSVNWPNIATLAVWLASVGTLLVGAVRGRKARVAKIPGLWFACPLGGRIEVRGKLRRSVGKIGPGLADTTDD